MLENKSLGRQVLGAPFSLTAADGTGLKLISVDAQAVVDGPLAFTELKLVFENPADRVIEGRFNIVMPDGAAISRFAMKIQGKWMEGEVVEKQAARRAYEDALHQRRDPALLEQDAGNAFRARVFPINPRERKELIISWSNNLTKLASPIASPKGLPKIQRLELRALTAATNTGAAQSSLGGDNAQYQVTSVSKTDFTPDQDWVMLARRWRILAKHFDKETSWRLVFLCRSVRAGRHSPCRGDGGYISLARHRL